VQRAAMRDLGDEGERVGNHVTAYESSDDPYRLTSRYLGDSLAI
jgi:hypothetical protein